MEEAKDLSRLIAAHSRYIDTITSRALLDEDSRELCDEVVNLLDVVNRYRIVQVSGDGWETKERRFFEVFCLSCWFAEDDGGWGFVVVVVAVWFFSRVANFDVGCSVS